VWVLRQVCHSLAEAHARGLVHRDITPANIYLCRMGLDYDFVKVLDFGLVKSRGDERATEVSLTRDHHVGGTPAFMAPEQILGDKPTDGRSDIYAIGCLGYWLVTGQLVFSGRTPMETMLQHTQLKPVPPSQRTELEIPEAFDRVILACLEKLPDDRPATAEDLAARLASIETAGAWTQDAARHWWDANHPRIAKSVDAAAGNAG